MLNRPNYMLRQRAAHSWHFVVSGRPLTSIIAGILSGGTLAFRPGSDIEEITRAMVAFTCITMAGFVFNDVHDREKDRVKRIQRPITRGAVSIREAVLYALFLSLFAVFITPGTTLARVTLIFTCLALIGYSYFAYWVPPLKGVYTAALCCTPLVYAVVLTRAHIPGSSYALLATFILGREACLDVLDLEVDANFGLRTLPQVLGPDLARRTGVLLMICSMAASVFIVSSPIGVAFVGASLGSMLILVFWPGVDFRTRILWSRLSMLLGAVALASTIQ